jgi:hypothetical protein
MGGFNQVCELPDEEINNAYDSYRFLRCPSIRLTVGLDAKCFVDVPFRVSAFSEVFDSEKSVPTIVWLPYALRLRRCGIQRKFEATGPSCVQEPTSGMVEVL